MIDKLFGLIEKKNGEKEVHLHSVIVHETDTGYAQCFKEDAYNESMGTILLEKIIFSDAVATGFADAQLFEKLKNGTKFINPESV
jgi:6-pyruvoyltetrahydropterin/6-carboxytetrahydropterin synthase